MAPGEFRPHEKCCTLLAISARCERWQCMLTQQLWEPAKRISACLLKDRLTIAKGRTLNTCHLYTNIIRAAWKGTSEAGVYRSIPGQMARRLRTDKGDKKSNFCKRGSNLLRISSSLYVAECNIITDSDEHWTRIVFKTRLSYWSALIMNAQETNCGIKCIIWSQGLIEYYTQIGWGK